MSQRFSAPIPLRRVREGERPSASAWNAIVDTIETLRAPEQSDAPSGRRAEDPEITEEEAEDTTPATTTATTWTEISKVTTTVDVDGVSVKRREQSTMRDTQGNTMTWIFDNSDL